MDAVPLELDAGVSPLRMISVSSARFIVLRIVVKPRLR